MRTHTSQYSHCDKAFSHYSSCIYHLKHTHHIGNKSYQCNQFDNSYTNSSILIKHRRLYTGEKQYQCTQCDKAFTQKSYLKYHLRRHTGEKPYQYNICDKAFSYTKDLAYTAYMTTCQLTI